MRVPFEFTFWPSFLAQRSDAWSAKRHAAGDQKVAKKWLLLVLLVLLVRQENRLLSVEKENRLLNVECRLLNVETESLSIIQHWEGGPRDWRKKLHAGYEHNVSFFSTSTPNPNRCLTCNIEHDLKFVSIYGQGRSFPIYIALKKEDCFETLLFEVAKYLGLKSTQWRTT